METRKWTFANVVLVRGQSYSIGVNRFLPGRTVRVSDPRLAKLLRGNTAFQVEDHWADGKPSPLAEAKAAGKPVPEPDGYSGIPEVPAAPEVPRRPEPSGPPLEHASGVPVGAFVVTTESKPTGKKVLKKRTKVD